MNFWENSDNYKQYLDMCESPEYQKLRKFYSRKTIFDILGVARQENPHSSFLAWLLGPNESHEMGDFPLKQFLKTACFAYVKYGRSYLLEENLREEKLKGPARERLLFYDRDPDGKKEKMRRTLMQGSYRMEKVSVQREKPFPGGRRADIYITLTLCRDNAEQPLVILIENKVTSGEHNMQTEDYMRCLLGNEVPSGAYVIPIYLYVSTNSDMTAMSQSEEKVNSKEFPSKSRLFLLLNYQYLMDGVLSPCLTWFSDASVADILRDYITCLGKSIEVEVTEDKKTSAEQITMAVGPDEKRWSAELWEKHEAVLMAACKELSGSDSARGQGEDPPGADGGELFLTATDADRQFYYTVANCVLEYLEGAAQDGVEREKIDALNSAVEALKRVRSGNKKPVYFVKQKNGEPWAFVSASRGNKTVGALAYVLLRQYIEMHPGETTEEIRNKLNIKNGWLKSMLVTGDELRDFLTRWADAEHSGAKPVCEWHSEKCPLALKDRTDRADCPMAPGVGNKRLVDAAFDKKGRYYKCLCIYDVLHSFFTGGIEAMKKKVQEQNWEEVNGRDLSDFFTDEQETGFLNRPNFGINETFGPIEVDGWPDGFAYVARYWGADTIEKLKTALDLGDYVASSRATAENIKALNFDLKDCAP